MCNESVDVNLELGELASSKSSALLIGPLVALVQDFADPTLDTAEDFLLATLRAHRGLDGRFVTSFLLYSLPHMVIGYLLLLAAVITLFVYICAVCRNCCSKSHGKANCGELCFFFEGLLFVFASAFLLLGVVSQLQTALRVDSALQLLPEQGSSALVALITLRANLHLRIEELRQDHSQALKFVIRSVADLPDETTMLATNVMGPLAKQSHHLASEIRRHLQIDINATDVMLDAGTALSNATAVTYRVSRELFVLAQRVRSDVQLPAQSRRALASAIDSAREAAQVELMDSELPDWANESAALSFALDTLLPAIMASAQFERDAPATLLRRLESRVLAELRMAVHNAGVNANETANGVATASQELLPQRLLDELATRLEAWQWVVASLDVGRAGDGSASFSGRALLVLGPGLHGIATLLVAASAATVSVVEIRRHHAAQPPLFDSSSRSLGARLLWICGMFAASLLWLHLLLAGGLQLLSHVGSAACRPLLDQRIFRDVLDNPQVWSGKTYLDMKIPGHVCRDNSTNGTRMSDVLDRCRRHQNLLVALGFDLGPALSEELKHLCPDVNSSRLEHALDEGLLSVEWLNAKQVSSMRTQLQHTHAAINLTVAAQVKSEAVNLTVANVTERHLRPLLLALPRDPSYDYIQEEVHRVINDITRLEVDLLPNLEGAMQKLAELRRALALAMQHLRSLSAFAAGTSAQLHRDLRAQARALAQACAAQANQRMHAWQRSVGPGVGADLGSCHAVYDAFITITRGICGEGLALANAVWVTHTLMAIALMAIMVLSCHLGVCLRGARVRYLRMRLLLQSKISEQAMQEALSVLSIHEIFPPRDVKEPMRSSE